MKRMASVGLAIILFLFLISCAPGPNDLEKTPNDEGKIAGFWKGIWQGLIAPITFIISIFSKNFHFYEVHNNGFWYNFGFVLGAGLFFSGGIFGRTRTKKVRCK